MPNNPTCTKVSNKGHNKEPIRITTNQLTLNATSTNPCKSSSKRGRALAIEPGTLQSSTPFPKTPPPAALPTPDQDVPLEDGKRKEMENYLDAIEQQIHQKEKELQSLKKKQARLRYLVKRARPFI